MIIINRILPAAAALALLAVPAAAHAHGAHHHHHPPTPAPPPLLTGRAVLASNTFAPGPPSAQHVTGATNGVSVPFSSQPVQGFSGVIAADDDSGDTYALADNGYGTLESSADFDLRIYRLHLGFRTPSGGSGQVKVKSFIELRDPDRRVPFTITNEYTKRRILTGADFDPESIQRDPRDGTLWIGEEFGPFLLHFSPDGRLLDAPIATPDPEAAGQELRSPQSPLSEESAPQRIMNALNARGRARGATTAPVVSPDATMLADGDPATTTDARPAGSGVSSEIFDVAKLHAAGYKVVPYTVNDPAQMDKLLKLGVDGLISDRSDLLYQRIAAFDANGDGTPGDDLLPDGRVDPAKFDAEGHRGSRNLRPENTLPAMEAGLDNLINTIETDNGVTRDGVPVLDHEPYVSSVRCRRADGTPYAVAGEELVKDLTLAELQAKYTCDNVFRGAPQTNDRAQSPIAVAFAAQEGLRDPYVMPSTQELFDFVRFYADWYTSGPGHDEPGAAVKAANARAVRFNIETKTNPRTDTDDHGNAYVDRTIAPKPFADAVTGVIEANPDDARRSDVQSFDFRTLLRVQDTHPDLSIVALWGDTPHGPGVDEDGTNLQPTPGSDRSAWLAGMQWPYRQTAQSTPFRVPPSGGFEGMAQSPDGRFLYPMLEKPLTGDTSNTTSIFQYDLRRHRWTGARWRYAYDPQGVSIGDFQLADADHGLTLERDNGQGPTAHFKTVEALTLGPGDGHVVTKRPALDELAIPDPFRISLASPLRQPGDLGLGSTFALPFNTIEDLQVLSPHEILIGVDNNYPFSVGRHVGSGAPDDDEFVTVRLARAVGSG
jgi:glycerophosphoryl diester phosphodiesterase